MVECNIINQNIKKVLYCQVQCGIHYNMAFDRKLIKNGNGWALCINSTILQLLNIDPSINMVQYTVENDKLIITKSNKNITDVK